jgi:type II secretory pathway predicted ATPase ExeA
MKNATDATLSKYMHLWGARSVPFSASPREDLFETESTTQARDLLQQTAALRSVMLLSGDNGVGKTSLVASWLTGLEPKAYMPLRITQASLSATGLLATLVGKFGRRPSNQRSPNLAHIEEAIASLGRTVPVLVLDDAQNYTASAMEEIRLLLGMNLSAQPVFALVLIADNYLIDALRLQSRRALYSRIAISYQLPALTPDQIEDYLLHCLKHAGIDRLCFDPLAIELIASASDGVPRTLNLLARSAWIEASSQKDNSITPDHVQAALKLVPVARDKISRA